MTSSTTAIYHPYTTDNSGYYINTGNDTYSWDGQGWSNSAATFTLNIDFTTIGKTELIFTSPIDQLWQIHRGAIWYASASIPVYYIVNDNKLVNICLSESDAKDYINLERVKTLI